MMSGPSQPLHPGGPMDRRPLDYILIVDCSSSMQGSRISALNSAIADSIPTMRKDAAGNPEIELFLRAVAFSSGAWWHVEQRTAIDDFMWPTLAADGITDLGDALQLIAEDFEIETGVMRVHNPALALITDGRPTDDWQAGLGALLATPLGKKAIRFAIALGNESDREVLDTFVGGYGDRVFPIDDASGLVRAIKWSSTEVAALNRPRTIGGPVESPELRRIPPSKQRLVASVIGARCQQTKARFGIRCEKAVDGRWQFTWAFPLEETAAGVALPTAKVEISKFGRITESFRCPGCGNPAFADCDRCHRITCCAKENGTPATCAWCTHADVLGPHRGVSPRAGYDPKTS